MLANCVSILQSFEEVLDKFCRRVKAGGRPTEGCPWQISKSTNIPSAN